MPEFLEPAFVRIRTGLLKEKHVQAMGGGSPLVVYLYLQSRVRFRGPDAGVTWEPYSHAQCAKDLGLRETSVKGWFQTLRRGGYIEARQLQRGLEVRITKYGQGEPASAPSDAPGVATERTLKNPGVASQHPRVSQPAPQGEPASAPSAAYIKEARAQQENKRTRESSPPLPPPEPAQTWQTELAQAFLGRGLPEPDLTGNEGLSARKLLRENSPDLIARCWQDVMVGEYPDDWLQRNLSFVALNNNNRFNNWLMAKAGRTTPAKRTGHVKRGASAGLSLLSRLHGAIA